MVPSPSPAPCAVREGVTRSTSTEKGVTSVFSALKAEAVARHCACVSTANGRGLFSSEG